MKNLVKTLLFGILALVAVGCGPSATTQQLDLYGTSVVAGQQALVSGLMLTGTAQAPITHITETSAAFEMQQVYAAATEAAGAKTATVAAEQTRASWTQTPSPTTTPNPTTTIQAAQVIAIQTSVQLDTDRKVNSNKFWTVIAPIFLLAVLLLMAFGMIQVARYFRKRERPRDERGDAVPLEDTVTGEVIDMDANPNYSTGTDMSLAQRIFEQWLERTYGFKPLLPAVTADQQDRVKERDHMIDLRSRAARLPKPLVEKQPAKALSAPAVDTPLSSQGIFPLPGWEIADGWDRNVDMLPCGNSTNGMEYWNLKTNPHGAGFGMSGSGKSRRLLRPLITFMLASNQQVILIGKVSDFFPFIGHPNVVFLPIYDITERDEAMKYAQALTACVEEKNRRIQYLSKENQSLWPHERTFIVLDELGNALLEMDNDLAELTMKKARSIVNEGRKAGMNLFFTAQRPKGFIDLTTQCGRAVFLVESDQERKYALGMNGAERLPEIPTGYFYKKLGALQLTGAFEPEDDEITAYLTKGKLLELKRPDWIDGVAKSDEAGQADAQQVQYITPKPDDVRVRELAKEGKSMTAIVWEIWRVAGGSNYRKRMQQVKEILAGTSTTTAEIMPNQPLKA